MSTRCAEITIASEERWSDWSREVDQMLAARGLDVADARADYSFRAAWEDGESTTNAVNDCEIWLRDRG